MAGSDVNWKIKISIIVEIKNLKWGGSIRPKPDNQLIFGLMVKFGPLVFYLFGPLVINVTSFSSISYYSNVRLISKIELEQNFQSIILDVHASANKRSSHLFVLSYAAQTNITPPFNSCLKLSFRVVHEIEKGYPKFQIKIHKPNPDPNGGQHIRLARGLVRSNRYINRVFLFSIYSVLQIQSNLSSWFNNVKRTFMFMVPTDELFILI